MWFKLTADEDKPRMVFFRHPHRLPQAQAVILAKAGIQRFSIEVDPRFLPAFAVMTGNDGLSRRLPPA